MEHRKVVTRTVPPQPEQTLEVHIRTFTCDRCGTPMPESNMAGGYLPDLEGTVPRNKLQVYLNREHFSGSEDGYQRAERDYCDLCLPDIWKDIMHILRYDPGTV